MLDPPGRLDMVVDIQEPTRNIIKPPEVLRDHHGQLHPSCEIEPNRPQNLKPAPATRMTDLWLSHLGRGFRSHNTVL
jgi:hypothetical protein